MLKLSRKKVLYVLFAYVLLQFIWWEILLVKVHHANYEKEKKLKALNTADVRVFEKIEEQLNKEQRLKIIMIVGEGTVFLVLMLFGFYRLLRAYEREAVMNERQMHFLLSLPHEIKTPLSVIQLNLQTILRNPSASEEDRKKIIEKSLYELKRLHNLVEQLLLTNKISKGKHVVQKEHINLSEQLKNWVLQYNEQKPIHQHIEENLCIDADIPLIQLVIQNLLDNAVKFSEDYIEVKLFKKEGNIYLEIMNDGNLILDEEKEKIFELFYRIKSEEERGIKGTGLGLYLVKEIAYLHGFKINVFTKNKYNVFQIVF